MRISLAALVIVGLLHSILAAKVPVKDISDAIDDKPNDTTRETTVVTTPEPTHDPPFDTTRRTTVVTTPEPTHDPPFDTTRRTTVVTTPEPTHDQTFRTTRISTTTGVPSAAQSYKRRSTRIPFIKRAVASRDRLSESAPEPNLQLAESCDEDRCRLPNCRCADTKLGLDIPVDKIPQLVTVTFDDAITALNYEQFEEIFADIHNPDGCEATATFYFSHEYTDYTKVHKLWAEGHELALHSITHGMGTAYWKKATLEVLTKEFGQQLEMIEHFAKVDRNDIKGMRMPHFEIPGNNSYVVAQMLGLRYDSSWPTQRFTEPALWPYTLDFKSIQDCPIGRCPDASFPGLWINPLVNWEDVEGYKCAMLDACIHMPEDETQLLLEWMISNFNRHYLGNRAPFGVYLHSSWFQKGEHYLEAFKEFIAFLNRHPDVYFVTASQVIDYMESPVGGKPFKGCPKKREAKCQATLCEVHKVDTKDQRWLNVCSSCPEVYPWLDNPLGLSRPAA